MVPGKMYFYESLASTRQSSQRAIFSNHRHATFAREERIIVELKYASAIS